MARTMKSLSAKSKLLKVDDFKGQPLEEVPKSPNRQAAQVLLTTLMILVWANPLHFSLL